METSSILPSSSFQSSLKMSTTNSILASSLASKMTENKLTVGVKRQVSSSSNYIVDTSASKLSKKTFESINLTSKRSFEIKNQLSSVSKIDTKSNSLNRSLISNSWTTPTAIGSLSMKSSLSTASTVATSSISSKQPSVANKKRKVDETVSDDETPYPSYMDLKVEDNRFKKPKRVFSEFSNKEKLIEEMRRKVHIYQSF